MKARKFGILLLILVFVMAFTTSAFAGPTPTRPITACDRFVNCISPGSVGCVISGIACILEKPWLDYFN